MNADTATIDFETRSACSIRNCGSWRYSLDPTTEVLCMAFHLPYWDEGVVALWHPAFPHLSIPEADCHDELIELMEWIDAGYLIEAHNAWFERGIWTNIMAPHYGWPAITPPQWRDSAAKAAAHALPRNLDGALAALSLELRKDTALKELTDTYDAKGKRAMTKIAKPRKPRKAEREANVIGLLWWESRELFERLWAYCQQDVRAEVSLTNALDDLNGTETEVLLLDQTINERGFRLDSDAVGRALKLIAAETVRLNRELSTLTSGQVKKATQRAKMTEWFADEGLDLPDTTKETIDRLLASREGRRDITANAWRGLEIVRTLGRSSTAKYQAMRNWICPDERVHGGLLYHGAGTGRWSGAGVQPQNFPKGSVKDMEALWVDLKAGVPQPNLMEALAGALRGTIVAAPGTTLFVADYASIEARVVMWLAGDEAALDLFRSGADIYKEMAGEIYAIRPEAVDKDQRQVGKFAILGLGFQMGWAKFVATCANFGVTIEDAFAAKVVEAYRAKFWRVRNMWDDQNNAAIKAVNFGAPVRCGKMVWLKEGNFLFCVLPSGRRLSYPFPQVRMRETPWGEPRPALTFMGTNPYIRKWERQSTYGGSLVENQTQAVARDIMAEAMLRVEATGIYTPILTVHDEIIAEGPLAGDVHEFEQLLTTLPKWAKGCPVGAEGWKGPRYHK
jgi:DNA polymerase bacteriophage-type